LLLSYDFIKKSKMITIHDIRRVLHQPHVEVPTKVRIYTTGTAVKKYIPGPEEGAYTPDDVLKSMLSAKQVSVPPNLAELYHQELGGINSTLANFVAAGSLEKVGERKYRTNERRNHTPQTGPEVKISTNGTGTESGLTDRLTDICTGELLHNVVIKIGKNFMNSGKTQYTPDELRDFVPRFVPVEDIADVIQFIEENWDTINSNGWRAGVLDPTLVKPGFNSYSRRNKGYRQGNGSLDSKVGSSKNGVQTQNEPEYLGHANAIVSIQYIGKGRSGQHDPYFMKQILTAYEEFAKKNGLKVEYLERGDANYKFRIVGENAYFHFEGEHGKHKGNYSDASGRKHDNYLIISVEAEQETRDFEVDPKDFRIDFFAASTKGGQHANRNRTNAKGVHEPTGITAIARNRSQHQAEGKVRKELYFRVQKHYRLIQGRPEKVDPNDDPIRTYSFTNKIVTDHRLDLTMRMNPFLEGRFERFIEGYHRLNPQNRVK